MPDSRDLDKIKHQTWFIRNSCDSLLTWLEHVHLGNSVSKGGVRGHMEDIEQCIEKVYEILEEW